MIIDTEEIRIAAAHDAAVRIREAIMRLLNIWYDNLAAKILTTLASPCASYEAFSQEPCEGTLEKFLEDFVQCNDIIRAVFNSVDTKSFGDRYDSDNNDGDDSTDCKTPNQKPTHFTEFASLLSIGPPQNPFEINDRVLQLFTLAIREAMQSVDRMVEENQLATKNMDVSNSTGSPVVHVNTTNMTDREYRNGDSTLQETPPDIRGVKELPSHNDIQDNNVVTEDACVTPKVLHRDDIGTHVQPPTRVQSLNIPKPSTREETGDHTHNYQRYQCSNDEFSLLPIDINSVGSTPMVQSSITPLCRRTQVSTTVTPISHADTLLPTDVVNPSIDTHHTERVLTEDSVYDSIDPSTIDPSTIDPSTYSTVDVGGSLNLTSSVAGEVSRVIGIGRREYLQHQKEKKENVTGKIGFMSSPTTDTLHAISHTQTPSMVTTPKESHADQCNSHILSRTSVSATDNDDDNSHPARGKARVRCNKYANSDDVCSPSTPQFYDPTIVSPTAAASRPSRLTIAEKRRLYNEAVEIERERNMSLKQSKINSINRVNENQVKSRHLTHDSLLPTYHKETPDKDGQPNNGGNIEDSLQDTGDVYTDRLSPREEYVTEKGSPYDDDIAMNSDDRCLKTVTGKLGDTRHVYGVNTSDHMGLSRLRELMDTASDIGAQMANIVNAYNHHNSLHHNTKRRHGMSSSNDWSGKKPNPNPHDDPRYYALHKQLQRVKAEIIKEQREVGKVQQIEKERAQQKADLSEKRRVFRR